MASSELVVDLRGGDGNPLASTRASLGPLFEDAHWRGVLDGSFENDGERPRFELELRFAEAGIVESVALLSGGSLAGTYPRSTFAWQARDLVVRLLEEKRIESSEGLRWQLRARLARSADRVRRVHGTPYPLEPAELPQVAPGAFEIAVSARLLAGLRADILAARGVEGAVLLLGRICHDARRGAAMLEIREGVDLPAGRGGASRTHIALDASSFRAALEAARARGGVPVGMAHDHPPCELCAGNPACRATTVFLSADDVRVHAAAFPRAYAVQVVGGKLSTKPATEPGFGLWGWDRGAIRERTFRVIEDGIATIEEN